MKCMIHNYKTSSSNENFKGKAYQPEEICTYKLYTVPIHMLKCLSRTYMYSLG